MTDTCRVVMVDGEPIRVRGGRPMTHADAEAFADVVRAAKRRLAKDEAARLLRLTVTGEA